MPRLIITRGGPGCGKTTLTRLLTSQSDGMTKRICKDDLRLMADTTSKYGLVHMDYYNTLIRHMMETFFSQGFSVILDETFTRADDIERLLVFYYNCSKQYNFTPDLQILDLTGVPFEVTVARDKARHPSLGFDVLDEYRKDFIREGTTETIINDLPKTLNSFVTITKVDQGVSLV